LPVRFEFDAQLDIPNGFKSSLDNDSAEGHTGYANNIGCSSDCDAYDASSSDGGCDCGG